jgi:hypothetical protein
MRPFVSSGPFGRIGRRRIGQWIKETAPLRRLHDAVSIRILFLAKPAQFVARFSGAAKPMQHTGPFQIGKAALGARQTDIGRSRNRRLCGVKPAAGVVDEIEQQRMQCGQAITP